ncbi:hypothetical protein PF008_g32998 [Phytophthora fragariae]|uniref:Secreted protein n=1 Tax=Phytophthora fragariae TaxID=53985 RepID=A0A6G0PY66_9STRA|nr:hypothetical protein PF003_g3040 [Phytophthora fragariae]KAE9260863.1 hypothetical protein PF008_g32998 [Phytophthora fragariae]
MQCWYLADLLVLLYIYANAIVAVPPCNVPPASYFQEERYSDFAHQQPLGGVSRGKPPCRGGSCESASSFYIQSFAFSPHVGGS